MNMNYEEAWNTLEDAIQTMIADNEDIRQVLIWMLQYERNDRQKKA